MGRRDDIPQIGRYDRWRLANPWDDNPEPEQREEPFHRCECGAPLWKGLRYGPRCWTCRNETEGKP